MKELLIKFDKENLLIGKNYSISKRQSRRSEKKMVEAKNNPNYSNFKFIEIIKNEETDWLVNKENIETIRTDFSNNFDSRFFDNSDETTLSTKISFILDIDGDIKNLKPMKDNGEFAYFCALSLYEMHKKYDPSFYKELPILTRYALPIKMNFE